MPRKTKEDSFKTRESIINAALNAFYQNGYAKTTLNGIARKLGLSKGAVYWHFNSKLDLFKSIADKINKKLKDELSPVSEKIETIEDLKNFIVIFARFIEYDREINKYITVLFFKIEWDEEMLNQILFIKDKTFKDFIELHIKRWQEQKIISDKLSAGDFASVLVAGFNGAILTNVLNGDFTETVKASVDIFFRGIEIKEI